MPAQCVPVRPSGVIAICSGNTRPKPPAARVQLATASPDLPLAQWRRLAQEHDGVILVAESGRVDGAGWAERAAPDVRSRRLGGAAGEEEGFEVGTGPFSQTGRLARS